MTKKRKAVRRRPKSPRKSSKPVKGRKQRRAEGGTLEAAGGLDSCLSLIPAARVVASALLPKNFLPTEKLGETYLTSQERELFKARVVRGVKAAGCQIADGDVPAEEATTHSAVVMALRQNAHA